MTLSLLSVGSLFWFWILCFFRKKTRKLFSVDLFLVYFEVCVYSVNFCFWKTVSLDDLGVSLKNLSVIFFYEILLKSLNRNNVTKNMLFLLNVKRNKIEIRKFCARKRFIIMARARSRYFGAHCCIFFFLIWHFYAILNEGAPSCQFQIYLFTQRISFN